MANTSLERGPEDRDYINKAIEREMKKSRYNGNEFLDLAAQELISGKGYSLIKGEMFGKLDASKETVTKDKVAEYFDRFGGDEFKRYVFEKSKKSIVKEYQTNPELYWRKYAEDYDKRAAKGDKGLTAEEQKVSDLVAQVLFEKEKTSLHELSLKDAIDNGLFPKFEMKNIVARALSIWETQDGLVRKRALKKSTATSGYVSRRAALADEAKGFKTVHRTEYAMGSAEISPEASGTIPQFDKNMKYRAVGGVSMATWDAKKERPESEWRSKWSNLAKQYNDLYARGRLYNEFPTATRQSDKILGVLDALQRLNAKGGMKEADATFDAAEFKRDLYKRFGKDIIYGSYGVFNMLLALYRASQEVAAHGGQSNALYDLQVGGRAPKHRYSKLDTKALQDEEIKDAPKSDIPLQGKMPKEGKKLDDAGKARLDKVKAELTQLDKDRLAMEKAIIDDEAELSHLDPKSKKAEELRAKLEAEKKALADIKTKIEEAKKAIADFEREYGEPKGLLDQFNDEADKVVAEVEKSTGVKITKKPGMDGGRKVIDYEGEYKGTKGKLLRVTATGGKIILSKGGRDFMSPKDAVVKAQEILTKGAESLKSLHAEEEARKEKEDETKLKEKKEKWYKDFNAFLAANRNEFIQQRITITEERAHTFSFGLPEAKKTYDYKIGVPSVEFFSIPDAMAGKMDLWARVVNKQGTSLRPISTINVDFKNVQKFIADIKAAETEWKKFGDEPKV